MKKFFLYMTAITAMLVLCMSCSKDDSISPEAQQDFAKFLTAGTWEGQNKSEYKELGSWIEHTSTFVTMSFSRSGSQALSGTGVQIGYENSYKSKETERSEFKWNISGDRIYIEYSEGWTTVYARLGDCELSSSRFKGWWINNSDSDRRFVFDYSKSN